MTSKLTVVEPGRVGRVAPIVVVVTAAGLVGCGSSTVSSSSAAAASSASVTTPGATSASSATFGSGAAAKGTWFASGTYKGQTLQGPVTVGSVMCTPISVGGSSGVQVSWGGTVRNAATGTSKQISGDFSFPQLGSWTIPTKDFHTPTASLVVAGDYTNRYGLSSGTGGLGSGSLTAAATTGTVDATYSNGSDMLSLKGSWTCG